MSYYCNRCLQDCSALRHHCEDRDDYDLCPACFCQRWKQDAHHPTTSNHHPFPRHHDSSFWTSRLTSPALAMRRADPHRYRSVGDWALASLAAWPDRPFVGIQRQELRQHRPAQQQQENNERRNHHNGYSYVSHGTVLVRSIALLRHIHQVLQRHPTSALWGTNNDQSRSSHAEPPPQLQQQQQQQQQQQRLLLLEPTDPSTDQHALRMALWMPNSLEWVVSDVALALGGFVSVPISSSHNEEVVERVLTATQARLWLVHSSWVDRVRTMLGRNHAGDKFPHLLSVLVLGGTTSSSSSRSNVGITPAATQTIPTTAPTMEFLDSDWMDSLSLSPTQQLLAGPELIDTLFDTPTERADLMPQRRGHDLLTIIFTSGSTTTTTSHQGPKGTMQTHAAWCRRRFGSAAKPQYYVAALYRPLSYLVDRSHLWDALGCGGRCALVNVSATGAGTTSSNKKKKTAIY